MLFKQLFFLGFCFIYIQAEDIINSLKQSLNPNYSNQLIDTFIFDSNLPIEQHIFSSPLSSQKVINQNNILFKNNWKETFKHINPELLIEDILNENNSNNIILILSSIPSPSNPSNQLEILSSLSYPLISSLNQHNLLFNTYYTSINTDIQFFFTLTLLKKNQEYFLIFNIKNVNINKKDIYHTNNQVKCFCNEKNMNSECSCYLKLEDNLKFYNQYLNINNTHINIEFTTCNESLSSPIKPDNKKHFISYPLNNCNCLKFLNSNIENKNLDNQNIITLGTSISVNKNINPNYFVSNILIDSEINQIYNYNQKIPLFYDPIFYKYDCPCSNNNLLGLCEIERKKCSLKIFN